MTINDSNIKPEVLDAINRLPAAHRDLLLDAISRGHQVNEAELTKESLEALLQELLISGDLASGLVAVGRDNADLRTRISKERILLIISSVCFLISLIVIGFLLYLFSVYPKYKTFQTIDNSVICELKPEDNPMLTDVAIQEFAKTAVLSAYSFNYKNYRDAIGDATTRYFTSEGRAAFNRALRVSGSLDHIINHNLIMATSAISAPQIEEKGFEPDGTPFWIVRMPIVTEFFTGHVKAADSQSFVAQVRVVTSKRDAFNTKGIGVKSLTLRPYRPNR